MSLGEFHKLAGELLDEDCWAAGVRERIAEPINEEHGFYVDFAEEASRWD